VVGIADGMNHPVLTLSVVPHRGRSRHSATWDEGTELSRRRSYRRLILRYILRNHQKDKTYNNHVSLSGICNFIYNNEYYCKDQPLRKLRYFSRVSNPVVMRTFLSA
jgi:hypothetical protein